MKRRQACWIQMEMEAASEKGIPVSLNGVIYENISIDNLLFLLEENPYMMDYEGDERGKVISLNFSSISQY